MYSKAKLCFKHVSTLNLALYILFGHENSIYSCFLSVCIPRRPIKPVTINNTAHNNVAGKLGGNVGRNERKLLRKYVLSVLLH